MGEAETATAIEALRGEVAEVREELRELRRTIEGGAVPHLGQRSAEEQRASLGRMAALRERILRRRGGVALPSSADDIRQMREERSDEIPKMPRPLAERLAGLAQIHAVREAILRERGGEPMPPSADEIRQMREERTARVLGEGAGRSTGRTRSGDW